MRNLALAAITCYQRYLSPLKGYGCAFRIHCGRDSCSTYASRAIARHGLFTGLRLLGRRLDACSAVHHQHHPQPALRRTGMRYRAQAGHCDLPSCDLPSCDLGDACRVAEGISQCADCANCDPRWWQNRRRHSDDLYVRMPPPPGP